MIGVKIFPENLENMQLTRRTTLSALGGLAVLPVGSSTTQENRSSTEAELDETRSNRHPNPGTDPDREISDEGLTERFDITEDQAQTIVDETSTIEENGANPTEIHDRASELLELYNVDVSDIPVGQGSRGPRNLEFGVPGQKQRPANHGLGEHDLAGNSESGQE